MRIRLPRLRVTRGHWADAERAVNRSLTTLALTPLLAEVETHSGPRGRCIDVVAVPRFGVLRVPPGRSLRIAAGGVELRL